MHKYFAITQTCNKQQWLAYVGLSTQGEVLEWWKAYRHQYTIWEKVKNTIGKYYGDYCKPDRTVNEISDLNKQVQSRNT